MKTLTNSLYRYVCNIEANPETVAFMEQVDPDHECFASIYNSAFAYNQLIYPVQGRIANFLMEIVAQRLEIVNDLPD